MTARRIERSSVHLAIPPAPARGTSPREDFAVAALDMTSALLLAKDEGFHRLLVHSRRNLGGQLPETGRGQDVVVARMRDIDGRRSSSGGMAARS